MIEQIILTLCVFGIGWCVGGMALIYIAQRPQGYKAGNGKRYRLTEINK